MPRKKKFNPEHSVDAALKLFNRFGYYRTTLSTLLSHLNLSKSSFYHSFASKSALLDACLKHYLSITTSDLEKQDVKLSTSEYILAVFSCPDSYRKTPCFVFKINNECMDDDLNIQRMVHDSYDQLTNHYHQALQKKLPDFNREATQLLYGTINGLRSLPVWDEKDLHTFIGKVVNDYP
ncbi:MAG TPA: TetR/AcrR family transcriptional regulator [Cyclobacteriaceae bacterium]